MSVDEQIREQIWPANAIRERLANNAGWRRALLAGDGPDAAEVQEMVAELDSYETALLAVLDLHGSIEVTSSVISGWVCACGEESPCGTVRAIHDGLGVEAGEPNR